jgi:SAM-dependent methyltransferase
LAAHFAHVIATDASSAQIAAAASHPQITYRVAAAESSGLAPESADLITVAQALHWLDLPRFYAEAMRVLAPHGVVAVWTYGTPALDDSLLDMHLQHFERAIVGPYWPPERRHVESGYRDLPFPFEEMPAPAFAMSATWRLHDLLGYLRTWSATTRCMAAIAADPVAELAARMASSWGEGVAHPIRWPLSLRVGRKPES